MQQPASPSTLSFCAVAHAMRHMRLALPAVSQLHSLSFAHARAVQNKHLQTYEIAKAAVCIARTALMGCVAVWDLLCMAGALYNHTCRNHARRSIVVCVWSLGRYADLKCFMCVCHSLHVCRPLAVSFMRASRWFRL